MVKVQKLKEKILAVGKTQEMVADEIGIVRSTFYRKMKNQGKGFTIAEVYRMMQVIPMTREELEEIFFDV